MPGTVSSSRRAYLHAMDKLKIHGTFEDVLRVAMKAPAKPKAKKKAAP